MITINAIRRDKEGKSSSRRLRLSNKFPAILYCSLTSNICIELDHNIIFNTMINFNVYKEKLLLIIDKIEYNVKIQSIQHHAFKPKILHMDFAQIL
ncbi:MAG: 50S ribosomal protein L25 [Buchnera aphidicola (Melaphis rhois)]